jgi:hypothetical protein
VTDFISNLIGTASRSGGIYRWGTSKLPAYCRALLSTYIVLWVNLVERLVTSCISSSDALSAARYV